MTQQNISIPGFLIDLRHLRHTILVLKEQNTDHQVLNSGWVYLKKHTTLWNRTKSTFSTYWLFDLRFWYKHSFLPEPSIFCCCYHLGLSFNLTYFLLVSTRYGNTHRVFNSLVNLTKHSATRNSSQIFYKTMNLEEHL